MPAREKDQSGKSHGIAGLALLNGPIQTGSPGVASQSSLKPQKISSS
jgi:hypothetical protein